ncbi:hypothetical protein SAMN05421681_10497 [Lysobacter enzymogenes]|nr:hypothetical protein SAMN05421681_10497 [Lysobacter enzymogenes]
MGDGWIVGTAPPRASIRAARAVPGERGTGAYRRARPVARRRGGRCCVRRCRPGRAATPGNAGVAAGRTGPGDGQVRCRCCRSVVWDGCGAGAARLSDVWAGAGRVENVAQVQRPLQVGAVKGTVFCGELRWGRAAKFASVPGFRRSRLVAVAACAAPTGRSRSYRSPCRNCASCDRGISDRAECPIPAYLTPPATALPPRPRPRATPPASSLRPARRWPGWSRAAGSGSDPAAPGSGRRSGGRPARPWRR